MTYKRRSSKLFLHMLAIGLALSCALQPARAGKSDNDILIRDEETERTLKEWLEPALKVAGINPKSVNLILVQNPQINAFVAGGSNIFIYTGLIEKTENPGEMIGVMAHELGHIAGGHLVATRGAFERASYESILGAVLGIGAAIATGNGDAATAIISGSSSLATSRFLAHSRLQESSADQAALRFLEGAQMSPQGLVTFFHKLESEELLPADQQSAYMRTHPLTRDRIEALRLKAGESPFKDKVWPAQWIEEHARIKAKLVSFIKPQQVQWFYADGDTSVAARYARAIAAYRTNKVETALKEVDGLLAIEPANPYFQELKGQMLMDFGRVKEAVPFYRAAVKTLPDSGLLRMALGHALLESGGGDPSLREAIGQLERALQDEPRSTRTHRLLATAYGQLGQENLARVHLAEEAVLQRRLEDAKTQAKSVIGAAPKGSREALKAKDILVQIENLKKAGDEEE